MGRLVNVGDTVEILNGRYAGAIGRLIQTGFSEPCVVEILYPLVVVEPGEQITTIEPGSPELQELSLAYALTVHKVQGSEFPCVVAVIHKSHTYMHHRNLFYTGVTRARECAIIIGDRWGIKNCARVEQTERRRTYLSFITSLASEKVAV